MPVKQQISLWERFFNKDSVNGTILSALLYYRHFHQLRSLLKRSQWWTSEQLIEYQNERLRKLVIHAYDNVPFYRRSFDKVGLRPSDVYSVHDLYKLPFLTKEQVRNNIDDLRARNYPDHRFEPMFTGGTTGDPLTFYIERGKTAVNHFAFYLSMMGRLQCRLTHRYLFVTQCNESWKTQAFGRILVLSPYSLRDENCKILFEKIRKISPQYIIAYPSAISLLGHLIMKKGDDLFSGLRAILCAGETLYEGQRNFLESTFRCKVFSYYNQCEQVVFAATCENAAAYHVFPEYGVTELIGADGQLITHEGEKGEIVGTGFTNDIFPFIRYRTGDIGVYTNHPCSCGRHYPLLKKIEGRVQESIISKTGDKFPMIGMYNAVAKSSNQVKEYQYFQREPGEIVLRVVRSNGFTDKDKHLIVQRLTRTLGPGFHISVEYVDSVKRTSAGKVQFLVKDG
jgi:phenylacetate-CoA ligase